LNFEFGIPHHPPHSWFENSANKGTTLRERAESVDLEQAEGGRVEIPNSEFRIPNLFRQV